MNEEKKNPLYCVSQYRLNFEDLVRFESKLCHTAITDRKMWSDYTVHCGVLVD